MTAPGVSARRSELRAELNRKLIHLSVASLPLAWFAGLLTGEALRILLGAAVVVALGIEWGRRVSPALSARFTTLVGGLLRPHEAHSVTGATWLAVAMLLAAVALPEHAARTALWAGAVGDSTAALVGAAWQSRAARRSDALGGKSHVGSAACAHTPQLGEFWMGGATLTIAAVIGAIAALAERPRGPVNDNLRVTLAVGLAAWWLIPG